MDIRSSWDNIHPMHQSNATLHSSSHSSSSNQSTGDMQPLGLRPVSSTTDTQTSARLGKGLGGKGTSYSQPFLNKPRNQIKAKSLELLIKYFDFNSMQWTGGQTAAARVSRSLHGLEFQPLFIRHNRHPTNPHLNSTSLTAETMGFSLVSDYIYPNRF